MFGIISTKNICNKDSDFRSNYCGTCKAIAFEYGHSFRMALNFDVVFLSELYDSLALSNSDYSKITNYNCFNIPTDDKDIPFNLKYVAAVNIILTKYKIEDNIQDNRNKIIWKQLKKSSLKKVKKAELFLKTQNVDINEIEKNIIKQFELEKENIDGTSLHNLFFKYSKQTSNITSEIFKGIIKEDDKTQEIFRKIGSILGEIVYLSDAIKDVEKDYKNNSFNILTIDFKNLERNKEKCKKFVNERISLLLSFINRLPIENDKKIYFKKRIDTLYFSQTKSKILKVKLKERILLSVKSAKNISEKFKYFIPKYSVYIISISIFLIVTLLFPNVVFAFGATSNEYGCCSNSCHCCCDCSCSCCSCGSCDYDKECAKCDMARNVGGLIDSTFREQGFCKGCFMFGCGIPVCYFFAGCFNGTGNDVTKVIVIKEIPTCGKC